MKYLATATRPRIELPGIDEQGAFLADGRFALGGTDDALMPITGSICNRLLERCLARRVAQVARWLSEPVETNPLRRRKTAARIGVADESQRATVLPGS